jgi:peptide deformylase
MDYQDENWQQHRKTFSGLTARVILHEYDHLEGRLFIDHLSALKKKILKGKLTDITKGKIKVDYKMQFPG